MTRVIVVGLKEIINIIIPHFERYPLESESRLWTMKTMCKYNGHLNIEGIEKIIAIKDKRIN